MTVQKSIQQLVQASKTKFIELDTIFQPYALHPQIKKIPYKHYSPLRKSIHRIY